MISKRSFETENFGENLIDSVERLLLDEAVQGDAVGLNHWNVVVKCEKFDHNVQRFTHCLLLVVLVA